MALNTILGCSAILGVSSLYYRRPIPEVKYDFDNINHPKIKLKNVGLTDLHVEKIKLSGNKNVDEYLRKLSCDYLRANFQNTKKIILKPHQSYEMLLVNEDSKLSDFQKKSILDRLSYMNLDIKRRILPNLYYENNIFKVDMSCTVTSKMQDYKN